MKSLNSCSYYFNAINHIASAIFFLAKIGIYITMIIFIQIDYNGSWANNTCDSLKSWTLFWLIWSYIFISISFIIGFTYFFYVVSD